MMREIFAASTGPIIGNTCTGDITIRQYCDALNSTVCDEDSASDICTLWNTLLILLVCILF